MTEVIVAATNAGPTGCIGNRQSTARWLVSSPNWAGLMQEQKKQFLDQAALSGNHDIRALICLLTAGFAALGSAVVVGDPKHGWFWLPPMKFWRPWASTALRRQIQKLKIQKFSMVDVWAKEFFPLTKTLSEAKAKLVE